MNRSDKIYSFFDKYATTILVVAILLYVIIFFGLCVFKYNAFRYNSLDLAIFNQVFYNTSHGRLLQLSIHEPTYLGDHFTPIIILLSPLYLIYQNPITLLFLQTLILALSSWPIYLIAKKIFKKNNLEYNKFYSLVISLVWLLNPLVHNVNLFEFHILPFAVFLLFWVFYYYLIKKWILFFLFIFLSLLVREDVSLVVVMFGVLLIVDNLKFIKKENIFFKFKIKEINQLALGGLVCLFGVFWLFGSMKLIGQYSAVGDYKFLYYYSWLGNTPFEIIKNIFLHPLVVLRHFITISNFEMFAGLLLSFIFLPLFAIKYLLLLLGTLAQLLIGAPGGSALILETHYNLLLLPALVVASIYGFKRFLIEPIGQNSRFEIVRILFSEKMFLVSVFIIGIIYNIFTLGPIGGIVFSKTDVLYSKERIEIKKELLKNIPQDASVASGYEYLTNLSSHSKVYSMHYEYIGKKQFSPIDYDIPKDTEYLLIDFYDFFLYQIQFPEIPIYAKYFNNADNRMRNFLQNYELVKIIDDYALFKISESKNILPLYSITDKKPQNEQSIDLSSKIKFLGWQINDDPKYRNENYKTIIPISLFWQAQTNLSNNNEDEPNNNYQLKLLITDNGDGVVYEKFYPLGYGIYPTSEWGIEDVVKTNYWFLIPEKYYNNEYKLNFEIVQVDGYLGLDPWRTSKLKYAENTLKPRIIGLAIDKY